jgi:hypothetical protein
VFLSCVLGAAIAIRPAFVAMESTILTLETDTPPASVAPLRTKKTDVIQRLKKAFNHVGILVKRPTDEGVPLV